MKNLVATPAGRAHLLALVADSEANDEGRIFTALAKVENDPFLRKVAARHAADEARHAALLEGRIVANGAGRPQIPAHLDLLAQLDDALDGLMRRPIASREDVMRAYLLLQVLEERAVSQLPLFIAAFADVDPETSAVFQQLLTDERRHLGYCHAIALHDETLTRYRQVEARVFGKGTMTNLTYVIEQGMIDGAGWKLLATVGPHVAGSRP